MKKLWPLLVLLLSILFIGVGTAFAIKDINKETPSLKVASEELVISAVQVSYCWTNFGQTVCIDHGDAQVLMDYHQIQPTVIAQAANLELLFDETPTDVNIYQAELNNEGKMLDRLSPTFSAPTELGIYIYYVGANFRKGDVSYAFAIEVR